MAHIDPVTQELVPCDTSYIGPMEQARAVRRLVDARPDLTIEQIAQKIDKDPMWVRRLLYTAQATKEEKQNYLLDAFLLEIGVTDTRKAGMAKAILKEILAL